MGCGEKREAGSPIGAVEERERAGEVTALWHVILYEGGGLPLQD